MKNARKLSTVAIASMSAGALVVTGCSGGSGEGGDGGGSDEEVGVTLIVKTTTNPFYVAMQDGAEGVAEELGVNLTLAAGRDQGDEDTQIQAIENAISRGDQGILITPNGPGVEDALYQARDAGLAVIALDSPPNDPESVDITFGTDNYLAGQKIGEWTATKLDSEKAIIGMIDTLDDKVIPVDYLRDQGFLDGMGIDNGDPEVIGDEDSSGQYSGGDFEIVGHEAGQGAESGGRDGAETLLSKNPDINVLYTVNEPTAYGAYEAFEAAGATDDLIVASVDGGCAGVDAVTEGIISATSQQYPLKMAELGVTAVHELAMTGESEYVQEGESFYNTDVELITDDPQDGIESIDSAAGAEICWG